MDLRRIASAAVAIAATGLLGGCAVYSDYPAYATYPAAPVVYGTAAPVVVAPAPAYAAPPPPWYGPSISIGISGRSGHRDHRHFDGRDRGGRDHRRDGGYRH